MQNRKPLDERKLLLNKREINKLIGKIQEGFTIVPTKMYFKKESKIELAIAKGKKQFDKRAAKTKDWDRINQDIFVNQAK